MISLKNVTKEYIVNKNNKVTAVKDLNLKIKKNSLCILKGPSGSGKSTVLSMIAALSKPTQGEVIVGEKRISKLPDSFASVFRREHIGFIFQKYNLIPNLSVKENLLLPLIPVNPDEEEAEKILAQTMERFHISHKGDVLVRNLSGGEQQRTAIARSLINNPEIIIADEPTANLDEELSLHFIDALKELKSLGKTIVVATHDPLFFGLEFADLELEMRNGQLCS